MIVNFYIDKKKPDRKNRVRIFMYCSFEGKRVKAYTRQLIDKEDWNPNKQRMKDGAPNELVINRKLEALETRAHNAYTAAQDESIRANKSGNVTAENFKKHLALFDSAGSDKTFFDYWDDYVNDRILRMGWGEGTIKRMATVKKHLEALNKSYKLEFDSINNDFLDRFLNYHRDKGFSNSFTGKNINIVRWFMNWAYKRRLTTNKEWQYWEFKLEKPKEDQNIYTLTAKEFSKMLELKFDEKEATLERVRDVFVFGCCTGLRYGDLFELRKADRKNGNIEITTQKDGKELEIPLIGISRAILDKYAELPGEKALPVLSNQKYNDNLKDLGKKAELHDKVKYVSWVGNKREVQEFEKWEKLTTHVARKTFISIAVALNWPVSTISAITGHSSSAIQRYIKVDPAQKRQLMKTIEDNVKLKIA